MQKTATLSADGTYRYHLGRAWDPALPALAFLMLNPSTADADDDDPTIRRCLGFAKVAGYGAIEVVNLFGYRATQPSELLGYKQTWGTIATVGPENDRHITAAATRTGHVVLAWGGHGVRYSNRIAKVQELIAATGAACYKLGTTTHGHPRHPLMVPAAWPLQLIGAS